MSDTRKIKIWDDPYGQKFKTTAARSITFSTGVTVLTGCNGAGKSTLLSNIYEEIKNINIPVYKFSNLGAAQKMMDRASFEGDFTFMATITASSEGECTTIVLGKILDKIKQFIKTGKNPDKRRFFDDSEDEEITSTERWLLFDSIDSGYSIDNIIIIKKLFDLIIKDAKDNNIDLYIIVSTNAYEFTCESKCLDVISGKKISFNSYDDYKNFILKTSEIKEKRFEKRE